MDTRFLINKAIEARKKAYAPYSRHKVGAVAVASDGHDHSDYAGAICDTYTLKKARELGLSLEDYLENNNSFFFFKQLGEGIETGLLESNVADLMLVLGGYPKS